MRLKVGLSFRTKGGWLAKVREVRYDGFFEVEHYLLGRVGRKEKEFLVVLGHGPFGGINLPAYMVPLGCPTQSNLYSLYGLEALPQGNLERFL